MTKREKMLLAPAWLSVGVSLLPIPSPWQWIAYALLIAASLYIVRPVRPPKPNTRDQNVAFRKAWDARYEAGQKRAGLEVSEQLGELGDDEPTHTD